MGVSIEVAENGFTVRIEGRFDILLYDKFQLAYSQLPHDSTKVTVDLSLTDYLDSCALGMLLMLREHFDSTAEISLANANPRVSRTLATANFDKLFFVPVSQNEVVEYSLDQSKRVPLNHRAPQRESH